MPPTNDEPLKTPQLPKDPKVSNMDKTEVLKMDQAKSLEAKKPIHIDKKTKANIFESAIQPLGTN